MIGILAGMGPKSTGPFVDKVVEQCQQMYGAELDTDFPHMMIYSCPTPFYVDRPICHADMEKAILEGAKKLESTGVDFIAMPCNTAHLYYASIQKELSVPLLNMVDETIKEIPRGANRTALLATAATIESGIYQEALASAGLEYVGRESWQTCINELLSLIKKGQKNEAVALWNRLCSELAESVDTVLIACTDLNVVSDPNENAPRGLHFVDSSACLARAVVREYMNLGKIGLDVQPVN
ncbi:aspartate/glutamate racemase family protein [Paenibacillus chitinolyticus]|uniref:aspartate/glutamate racemase family protein n=1 Tax=Paenibacillus chitinolyticus TaxID=79263 RepID=UPI00295F3BF9|nr:amino acid racemase [Paenibacillus chitinolyticus]